MVHFYGQTNQLLQLRIWVCEVFRILAVVIFRGASLFQLWWFQDVTSVSAFSVFIITLMWAYDLSDLSIPFLKCSCTCGTAYLLPKSQSSSDAKLINSWWSGIASHRGSNLDTVNNWCFHLCQLQGTMWWVDQISMSAHHGHLFTKERICRYIICILILCFLNVSLFLKDHRRHFFFTFLFFLIQFSWHWSAFDFLQLHSPVKQLLCQTQFITHNWLLK